MLPVVAKVVLVAELGLLALGHLAQFEPPLVDDLEAGVGVRHTVNLVTGDELVQVGVRPAHDRLKYLVQLGEADVAGDLYPPPDRRLTVHERDLHLVDVGHV